MGNELDVVRQAYRAFQRRDVDRMLELVHPDLEFWTVTAEEAGRDEPYRGHEGMRRYFTDVAAVWEEVRPVPGDFEERGGWVVVTGRVYARRAGQVVDSSAGWHWQVREGLIVYGRVFRSSEEALSVQLGDAPGIR